MEESTRVSGEGPAGGEAGAELDEARREIDLADRELLHLLARRFEAVRRVAEAKRVAGLQPILDVERERSVQATWLQDAETLGLSPSFARRVLKEVLAHSRRLQEPALDAAARQRSAAPRVGFQGIAGAYSALAARHLLAMRTASDAELKGYDSFSALFDALANGDVDYVMLPIENSIAGSIAEVNRLVCEQPVHFVDEEICEIEHVLAALPGARLDGVRAVRSHPAALAQCEGFLRGLEGVERQPWFDTAGAAASLAGTRDLGVAVICSEEAARLHGLEVLSREVADRERNETRFVLAARAPEVPDGRLACKTSLLLRLNHHEGALARVLGVFADAKANLTRIESRPAPDTPWEYLFLVDVEGHQHAPQLAAALAQARPFCNQLRVLGSYPSRTRRPEAHLELHGAGGARGGLAPMLRAAPAQAPAGATAQAPAAASERAPGPQVGTALASGAASTQATGPAGGALAGAAGGACPAPRASPGAPRGVPRASGAPRATVRIGPAVFGEGHFTLIAGPCAVESLAQILDAAQMVRAAGATVLRGGAFKPRTSPYAFQGLGLEGLRYLKEAGRRFELPTVTEVLAIEDIAAVVAHADALQVGARNMQNFALLKELGRLDKPIVLKRGMSATVKELLLAAEYVMAGGNQQVILCERGIRTFETSTRATLDVGAIPVLRRSTHLPIIVDPSHAAGDRELVVPLALAGAAAGADGLIVEAHPRPAEALCDKEQALGPEDLRRLVDGLRPILASQGRVW